MKLNSIPKTFYSDVWLVGKWVNSFSQIHKHFLNRKIHSFQKNLQWKTQKLIIFTALVFSLWCFFFFSIKFWNIHPWMSDRDLVRRLSDHKCCSWLYCWCSVLSCHFMWIYTSIGNGNLGIYWNFLLYFKEILEI